MMRVLLAGMVAGLGLAGCATMSANQCDPRNADAGFLNKLGCNTQGVYAQRVVTKQQVLLDEQKANQLFREVYAELEREQRDVGQQLAQQQDRYAALNRTLDALLGEIRARAQGNRRIETEIAAIEQEMQQINQSEAPSVLQKRLELEALTQRINALESDLGLQ